MIDTMRMIVSTARKSIREITLNLEIIEDPDLEINTAKITTIADIVQLSILKSTININYHYFFREVIFSVLVYLILSDFNRSLRYFNDLFSNYFYCYFLIIGSFRNPFFNLFIFSSKFLFCCCYLCFTFLAVP